MESGWRRRGKSVGREYSTHKPRHLLVPSRLLSLALPPRLPRARAFCKGQEKQSRKQEYPNSPEAMRLFQEENPVSGAV